MAVWQELVPADIADAQAHYERRLAVWRAVTHAGLSLEAASSRFGISKPRVSQVVGQMSDAAARVSPVERFLYGATA